MCGIVGFFAPQMREEDLRSMADAVAHRGPDASGYYVSSPVGLGHRRLSILDLSEGANQPFYSQDGRFVMVYNGEIYNFEEIKEALKKEREISFRTSSDTEVILEAWAHWGTEAIHRFNGMFAIAIWDEEEEKLWLLRDRVGIKPLYYFYHENQLIFASEIKAIKKVCSLKPDINKVATFLYLGYLPQNQTFYQHTFKLLPGTIGCFEAGSFSIHTYWKPEDIFSTPKQKIPGSFEEAKRTLLNLIQESVQYRMISDVPLGTFLSGGTDSSTVTAIAQSLSDKPIQTFSIGFNESKFNEAPFAKKIAKQLKTQHHEFLLSMTEAQERVEKILEIYDEPYADASAVPTLLISEMARKHVTVALSGDGGDELFLGYGMYQWAKRLHSPWGKLLHKPVARALALSGSPRLQRAGLVFDYANPERLKSHIFSQEQYFFRESELALLLKNRIPINLDESHIGLNGNQTSQERQAFFDFKNYLPEDLLIKVDKASMFHSLEVRVPLLDHRVVAYALTLPESWKVHQGVRKYILKEILYEYVPKSYFDRPKWGFSIPLGSWLKSDLKYLIDVYLSKELVESVGIVKSEQVEVLKADFMQGKDYLYNRLWVLILLHRWFSQH